MFVQAVKDKIIVEVLKEDKTSEGGIVIPDGIKTEPQEKGLVISVGPEVSGITRGDTILFHRVGGQVFIFERKIYKALGYSEIYGVVKDASV